MKIFPDKTLKIIKINVRNKIKLYLSYYILEGNVLQIKQPKDENIFDLCKYSCCPTISFTHAITIISIV